MATLQIAPTLGNRVEIESNFLGSNWSFYVLADGSAYWIHKSGKVLPSSRNWGKEE